MTREDKGGRRVKFSIVLPEELVKHLDDLAEEADRPRAREIERALREYVRRESGRLNKPEADAAPVAKPIVRKFADPFADRAGEEPEPEPAREKRVATAEEIAALEGIGREIYDLAVRVSGEEMGLMTIGSWLAEGSSQEGAERRREYFRRLLPGVEEAPTESIPKPNGGAAVCSVAGCGITLRPAQVTICQQKFGGTLFCSAHQQGRA